MLILAWIALIASLLAAGVWSWINLTGRGASLDHVLDADVAPPIDETDPPRVAVICPGRDEARWLPETLPAICTQHGVDHRVIFVDDDSSDATPGICAELTERFDNLTVMRNEQDPPAGWVGKAWAVHQGVQALREMNDFDPRWVCFTDADIHWHPGCLRAALDHAAAHDAQLVCLLPRVDNQTAWERLALSQMALAIGVVLPLDRAMDPRRPDDAIGAGAFLLVRRDNYDAIGGHEAVKGQMVEDIELTRALKRSGVRLRIAHTQTLLHCRMYEGLADLWEGLTKNAFAALERSWLRFAALFVGTLICNILPPVYAVAGGLGWWLMDGPAAHVFAVAALLGVISLLWQARAMRAVRRVMAMPWWYVWSLPVGSAFYLMIVCASVGRHLRGRTEWKGRRYA